jgi:hypothetical protein
MGLCLRGRRERDDREKERDCIVGHERGIETDRVVSKHDFASGAVRDAARRRFKRHTSPISKLLATERSGFYACHHSDRGYGQLLMMSDEDLQQPSSDV